MLVRGALVAIDPFNPVASVNVFQYNPHTLTRRLRENWRGDQGGRKDTQKLPNVAPREYISLDIEIDAADQLETSDPIAGTLGIHPQLAAFEMMMYPKSALVIANTLLMATGSLELAQPLPTLTLFIWGAARVLPVRVDSFSFTETAHDHNLNPIQAKASVSLTVLNYNDFPLTHPGYGIFLAHQVVKEAMAVVGSVTNVVDAVGG